MKNINLITNQIQNSEKNLEFKNFKNIIIPYIHGPLCDFIKPFEFIIFYLTNTNHYYICQTTIKNDIICLDILNNENELKKLTKKLKNNIYNINISNGQLKFYSLNNSNEIYISPEIKEQFFRYC